MNHNKIPHYVSEVCKEFGIDKATMLKNTKRRSSSEPRQIFYLVCHNNGIPITYIQDWLAGQDFTVDHSTIVYGKKRASLLVSEDPDLKEFVDNV
jgi:chromosomal replication initiation ATPase DnaA